MVSPDEYRSDQTSVALGKFETNNAAAYCTVLSTKRLPTQFNKQHNCHIITRAFFIVQSAKSSAQKVKFYC